MVDLSIAFHKRIRNPVTVGSTDSSLLYRFNRSFSCVFARTIHSQIMMSMLASSTLRSARASRVSAAVSCGWILPSCAWTFFGLHAYIMTHTYLFLFLGSIGRHGKAVLFQRPIRWRVLCSNDFLLRWSWAYGPCNAVLPLSRTSRRKQANAKEATRAGETTGGARKISSSTAGSFPGQQDLI